eukprot:CAMPEP_0113706168 /NCGR_PEP_ID=MMETSP0038_2-20120614/27566_1 /TAXON_ID=2898 /ORGANISM="Cryptomonas paramecium" /LENGTH=109 /DNA_ID=CAMNT_0000631313 /DNA_START=292 /DNA_END=618 /DNA_ORIENTATION=+ /assembly_acc=CAM_ASM_000170
MSLDDEMYGFFSLEMIAQMQHEFDAQVMWAQVKSPLRAVEKVMRSYGGDPTLLVDICRQTLVYKSLPDLALGLEAILSDPDVSVVRIKNRMEVLPAESHVKPAGGAWGA